MSSGPDFFSARNVHGRRAYVCAGCKTTLPKGCAHVSVSSRSLGETWSKRYCTGCAAETGVQISTGAKEEAVA